MPPVNRPPAISLPPPPDVLQNSPRYREIAQLAGVNPYQVTSSLKPDLPPPPGGGKNFLRTALPFLPGLIGAGIAIGSKSGSGMQHLGAGLLGSSSKVLLDDALQKRQAEFEQSQNVMKNTHKLMDQVRQIQDPRAQEIVNQYNAALIDGKLDAKEASNLNQMAMSLDIEGMMGQQQDKRKLSFMEAEGKLKGRMEQEQLEKTGIPLDIEGQKRFLEPKDYLTYKGHEADRAMRQQAHERMLAQSAQDARFKAEDDARARIRLRWEEEDRAEARDPKARDIAAKSVLSGTPLPTAMLMMGDAGSRGSAGSKIIERAAELADANTPLITDKKAKMELTDLNQSRDLLGFIEKEANRIMKLPLGHREIEALQLKRIIEANSPRIAKATGAAPVSDFDAERALGLPPKWWEAVYLPKVAKTQFEMAQRNVLSQKTAIVEQFAYGGKAGEAPTTQLPGGFSFPALPAPPGTGPSNDPFGLRQPKR